MRALAAAAALLAVVAWPSLAAVEPRWELAIGEYGLRRATAQGEATLGEHTVPAALQLQCAPGADGTLSWILLIEHPERLAGFDFGAFEGPDAPTNDEPLSRLALEGGVLRTAFATATTGSYLDAGRFSLQFMAPATAASSAGLLAEAVDETTDAITWTVSAPGGSATQVAARFAADAAAPVLRDAMLGCGPPPALGDAQLSRWLGRNPHAVSLFEQRAVAWRLHALLGTEHERVLARFASAQPLARDGDVLFVLAPARDDPKSGAAILLPLTGSDALVIEIDAGQVRRHGVATFEVPAAVRAFVAARSGAGE